MGFSDKNGTRMNPIVIRTKADGKISWARSYQVDHIYTRTNGLLSAGDGGVLLFGNSFIGTRRGGVSHGRNQPIYEKMDASGTPLWGGTVPFGFIKPWSAVSDAIHLGNGGYALTGSGTLNPNGDWYGLVLTLDANGNVAWLKFMRVRDD